MYNEWKCSCGMSSMGGVLVVSDGGVSALWSAVSMALMFSLFFWPQSLGYSWPCGFIPGRERHIAFQ